MYDADTKLIRFGAGDYDPTVGRWTTKDPIGFAGGDTNLYAYVGGNPMSYNDPTGLTQEDLDFAMSYLRENNPELFVNVNPTVSSFPLSSGIYGVTPKSGLILFNMAHFDQEKNLFQRRGLYINTIAHELMHANDLKTKGYGYLFSKNYGKRHDQIYETAGRIYINYLLQRKEKISCPLK